MIQNARCLFIDDNALCITGYIVLMLLMVSVILVSFCGGILSIICSCIFASHLNYISVLQYRFHVIGTLVVTCCTLSMNVQL